MGKVDRLRNRVEPFAALFWALGIVLANTWSCPSAGQALLRRRTQSMTLYGHRWFNSQRERVGPPPLFLTRYVIYPSLLSVVAYFENLNIRPTYTLYYSIICIAYYVGKSCR